MRVKNKKSLKKKVQGFAPGGPVEADDSDEEYDSLPAEAQPVSQPASPADDQPQAISMDDARKLGYSEEDQPQAISMDDARKLGYREAEGLAATAGREAAHAVVPAAAGVMGYGAGALAGAGIGTMTGVPVVGTIAGAALGLGASALSAYGASKAQEGVLDATGMNDREQREANQQENPNSALIGEMAPNLLAMSPGALNEKLAVRVLGGGIVGGIDAAQQYAQTGRVNPVETAGMALSGAAFPKFNRAGEALAGAGETLAKAPLKYTQFLPKTGAATAPVEGAQAGFVGAKRTPEGVQETAEATASQPLDPSGRGGNYTPPNEYAAVGNDNGERSERAYPKENEPAAKINTSGDIPDDVMAALGGGNEPAPESTNTGIAEAFQARRNQGGPLGSTPDAFLSNDEIAAQKPPEQVQSAPVETITSAALRSKEGNVFSGPLHFDALTALEGAGETKGGEADEGFVTSKGRFVNRAEALDIANNAGQRPTPPDRGSIKFKSDEGLMAHEIFDRDGSPVTKFLGNEEGGVTLPTKEDLKKAFLQPRKEWDFRNRPAASKQEQQAYDVADRYQQMKQRKVNNGIQGEQDSVVLDKVTTPEEREALFAARDKDAVAGNTKAFDALPDDLKAKYEQHLAPLDAERNTLFDEVKAAAPDKVGRKIQNQVAHIRSDVGPLTEGGQAANPIDGTLATIGNAKGSAIDRTVVGLENTKTGKRDVIELNGEGKGFKLWRDGKAIKNPDKNFEFVPGETYTIGKNIYKMGDATVAEKEAATPYKYHKDIAGSILNSRYQLANMKEELDLFKDITHSDAFHKVAQRKGGNHETPAGWRETKNPAFKDWEFDPYVAEALDDAASPGLIDPDSPWAMLRTANNAMLRTIFISPTAHIFNVGAHWAIGRGNKWAPTTRNARNFFETGAESVHSVLAQDDFQKQMRHEGAGTVYGGIIGNEREFTDAIAKTLRIAIDRQPARWEQIARDLHLGKPIDATKAIYDASQKAMWSVNDMFLTQAVKENVRNGMTMKDAIAKAEQHIPNYRVASRLIASNGFGRVVSQAIQEPALVAFGRYKAGMLNSWAHMGRDLIQGDMPRKKEAGAQFLVFGVMALAIWPLLNKLVQKVTGNKEAGFSARGPLSVPYALTHMGESGEPSNVTGSLLSLSPAVNISKELLTGKDFAGRDIVGKQELHDALHGSPRAMGRAAVEGGGHFLNEAVAPLGTATTAYNKGQNPLQWAAGQALDIKTPSEAAQRYEQNAPRYRYQDFIKRQKRPQTPYEDLYNKATGNQD